MMVPANVPATRSGTSTAGPSHSSVRYGKILSFSCNQIYFSVENWMQLRATYKSHIIIVLRICTDVIYADYDDDFDYCRLPALHRQAQVCASSVETQLRMLGRMLSSLSWEPSIQSVNVIHEGSQVEIMSVAIAGHIRQ